ncbi:MAG: amidohydrolase [Acidobacteriota bacterium]
MADSYEKLLVNGRIYTMDAQRSWKEAVIIRDDRIWKIGTTAEIRALASPDAQLIDLGGRFAMPGFIDAHVHFIDGGASLLQTRLKDCRDQADLANRLAEYVKRTEPGEWITGGGWDHEIWPDKKPPAAALLDKAAPRNPVFLTRHDMHMGVVNTRALRAAGITRETKSPEGGEIGRDAAGDPDGTLRDNAMDLVYAVIPRRSLAQVRDAAGAAQAEAARCGVTTVMDMGTAPTDLSVYTELHNKSELRVRMLACPPIAALDSLTVLGIAQGLGGNMLRIQGLKILTDGSMGSGTALFFEPYNDRPQTSGLSLYAPGELESLIGRADEAGFQLHIHAIGDRAIWMTLDDLSRLPPRDRRVKIEHVQVVRRQDFGLFKKTGAIASVEPSHILDDMHWCEKRVGERCKDSYAYGSLHRAGIPMAFGTDWPVEPLNPWLGIYAAVTRQDLEGKPDRGWFPEERMPLADALYYYTMGSAFAGFLERDLGSIEPGKLADIVVTNENPFEIQHASLKGVTTWMTLLGGEIVWK